MLNRMLIGYRPREPRALLSLPPAPRRRDVGRGLPGSATWVAASPRGGRFRAARPGLRPRREVVASGRRDTGRGLPARWPLRLVGATFAWRSDIHLISG